MKFPLLIIDLTIAAEIGQHLLQANQSLRHAYDELLHSDSTRHDDMNSPRMSSLPNTPPKFQTKCPSPLSPSPKKLLSFNMSDYVESLERKNHDLSQEIELISKKLSQSDRNNQKLNKDLETSALEIIGLKQQLSSSMLKSTVKGDKKLITSYDQLQLDHDELTEKAIFQEKELERLSASLHQLEISERTLKKELESKEHVSFKRLDQSFANSETQTSKAKLASIMTQTIDKSLDNESLSFFKSIAFINSKESSSSDFKQDQLFIPCRFPTSPQAITRSKTMHRDEWIMEMPDEFSFDHNILQSQKPKPAPLLPKNERLQRLMGQFVNYFYDMIL